MWHGVHPLSSGSCSKRKARSTNHVRLSRLCPPVVFDPLALLQSTIVLIDIPSVCMLKSTRCIAAHTSAALALRCADSSHVRTNTQDQIRSLASPYITQSSTRSLDKNSLMRMTCLRRRSKRVVCIRCYGWREVADLSSRLRAQRERASI